MALIRERFPKKRWVWGTLEYSRNDRRSIFLRMVKVLSHLHTSLKSSEPKFPKKIVFFTKFRQKMVSRILWGMSSLQNLFSFSGQFINKGFCPNDYPSNPSTFSEIDPQCAKSAWNYRPRNQLWRHRTWRFTLSGHLIRKIWTHTIMSESYLDKAWLS